MFALRYAVRDLFFFSKVSGQLDRIDLSVGIGCRRAFFLLLRNDDGVSEDHNLACTSLVV